jgi:hypothetical protein
MTKKLPIILLLAGLLMALVPMAVQASPLEFAAAEQLDERIEISVEGQTVIISGAQGEELIVVSLAGRQVVKAKIDSPSQRIELNIPKGCYILKVGKVVRKIQVR